MDTNKITIEEPPGFENEEEIEWSDAELVLKDNFL